MDVCIRIVTLGTVAAVLSGSSAPVATHQQLRSLAALARETRSTGTEQEWIVGEIVRGIERGVSRSRSTPSKTGSSLTVRTRPSSETDLLVSATVAVSIGEAAPLDVTIRDHVWAPDTYVQLARGLLGPDGRRPGTPRADDVSLAERLATPSVGVILAEETRVTAALTTDPTDPRAHGDAALLLATLALKENAGVFTDVRPLLSRTTSHLALARAFGGDDPLTSDARLAGIIVSVLTGRQREALAGLGVLRLSSQSVTAAWQTALRLRISGDWRNVSINQQSSLIEQLEYARALQSRVGPTRFLAFFDAMAPEAIADWHRVALQDEWNRFNIESGNRFADEGLNVELAEIAQVWSQYHDGEPAFDGLIASLSSATSPRERVLGWDIWAPVLERHLCAQLGAQSLQLRWLGLQEDVEKWPETMAPHFGGLTFFPLVVLSVANDASQYERAMPPARQFQERHPERVTARMSRMLRSKHWAMSKAPVMPSDDRWFTPHVPTGTAFDLSHRTLAAGCPRPVPVTYVERWAEMAPHDMWVAWALVWLRDPGVPGFAVVQKALGTIPEFDLRAARLMHEELNADATQYVSVTRMMCAVEPDECDHLGSALIFDGQESEAAAVLDRYANSAHDAVRMSHGVRWLVRYHWESGQRKRASEVALRAGATGSGAGLWLIGYVAEQDGRLAEAEAAYRRIEERYGEPEALGTYYLRQAERTGDPMWIRKAEPLLVKTFPNGIEKADVAWLPAPPTDGMTFKTFGRRAMRTTLRATDVIVGLDGRRVRSIEQYAVLVRAGFDTRMRFVVWRDGRYQEVVANVPQRWFGTQFVNHPAAGPAHQTR